jgi:hypothetical protein
LRRASLRSRSRSAWLNTVKSSLVVNLASTF